MAELVEVVDDTTRFPPEVRSVPTLEKDNGGLLVHAESIIHYLREHKENQN